MQISYTNAAGHIQHIHANIDPQVLEQFVRNHAVQPALRYRTLQLHNCENIPKLKTSILYYPSEPTDNMRVWGRGHRHEDSRENCYRQKYQQEKALGRYVREIAKYLKDTYFKRGYTVVLGADKFQYSYSFYDLDSLSLHQLNAALDHSQLGASCDLYFVKAGELNVQLKDGSNKLTGQELDDMRLHPWVRIDLCGNEFVYPEQLEARKVFQNTVILERDFGVLPVQRIFMVELENGKKGLMLTDAVEGKSLAAVKKKYAQLDQQKVKKLTEIDEFTFARIQSGAGFIRSVS